MGFFYSQHQHHRCRTQPTTRSFAAYSQHQQVRPTRAEAPTGAVFHSHHGTAFRDNIPSGKGYSDSSFSAGLGRGYSERGYRFVNKSAQPATRASHAGFGDSRGSVSGTRHLEAQYRQRSRTEFSPARYYSSYREPLRRTGYAPLLYPAKSPREYHTPDTYSAQQYSKQHLQERSSNLKDKLERRKQELNQLNSKYQAPLKQDSNAASTNRSAVSTNRSAASTNRSAVSTNRSAASTNRSAASTNRSAASTNQRADASKQESVATQRRPSSEVANRSAERSVTDQQGRYTQELEQLTSKYSQSLKPATNAAPHKTEVCEQKEAICDRTQTPIRPYEKVAQDQQSPQRRKLDQLKLRYLGHQQKQPSDTSHAEAEQQILELTSNITREKGLADTTKEETRGFTLRHQRQRLETLRSKYLAQPTKESSHRLATKEPLSGSHMSARQAGRESHSRMDFSNFRNTGELSDTTVVVEGMEFKLHKFPLYIK